MAISHLYGHKIYTTNEDCRKYFAGEIETPWRYEDGEYAVEPRPCPKCGRLPLKTGEDACLGHLPGVKFACCGHGKTTGYLVFENDAIIKLDAPPNYSVIPNSSK